MPNLTPTLKDLRAAKDIKTLMQYYKGENGILSAVKTIFADVLDSAAQELKNAGIRVEFMALDIDASAKTIAITHSGSTEVFFEHGIADNAFALFEEVCELLALDVAEELRFILAAAVKTLGAGVAFSAIQASEFAVKCSYADVFTLEDIVLKPNKQAAIVKQPQTEQQKKLISIAKTYMAGISAKSGENPAYAKAVLDIIIVHCGQAPLVQSLADILSAPYYEVNYITKTTEVITVSFANKAKSQQADNWETDLVTITPFGGNITLYSNRAGKSKISFEMGEDLKYIMQCLPNTEN